MTENPKTTSAEEQQAQWKSCDDRYVRNDHFWRWIVGAVGGSVILIATIVATLVRWGSAQEHEDAVLGMRIDRVEITQEKIIKISNDLDTLKIISREKR